MTGRQRTYAPDEVEIVPRWLRQGDSPGSMVACGPGEAQWIWVYVRSYNPIYAGGLSFRESDVSDTLLHIPMRRLGMVACYRHVDADLTSYRGLARALVVHMQAPGLIPVYGFCDDQCLLQHVLEAVPAVKTHDPASVANLSILTGRTRLMHYPVSQKHLRHIGPREVREVINEQPQLLPRLACLNNIVSEWGADLAANTWCTLAMYLLLLSERDYEVIRTSQLRSGRVAQQEWLALAKKISIRLKSIQNTVGCNLTPFFEPDVLINRGFDGVEWEAEERNRTTGLRVTKHTYQEFYKLAWGLFNNALQAGDTPARVDWDKFWERRWEWATPGAVHSQHEQDGQWISQRREYRTKWHTLSAMPKVSMAHWLATAALASHA